ncbi:ABC transporter ATP-binding protein [Candidatus Babeliales bacterium]|nr:ABC transporter ATP-binding protein [Candidatus Babeliales bacterium]
MNVSLFGVLRKLFTRRDKKVIIVLLLSSVLVSIVETLSLSAIMVFISIATNFNSALTGRFLGKFSALFGFSRPSELVLFLGFSLLVFYLLRAGLNVIHIYYTNKFSHMRQHYFASRLFERYLQFTYRDFVQKTSTSMSQVILAYSSNVTQIISTLLMMFAEIFTVVCIYSMLFYVNWKMTLVLSVVLIVKVLIVLKAFTHKITQAGLESKKYSEQMAVSYTASFCNFKFLKLISNNKLIQSRFSTATLGLARANTVNAVWQALPRFILETIGFSLLVGAIMYVVYRYNDAQFVIPMVSMYALAFYRFLPSINKLVTGYNQLMFNKHVLEPVHDFLHHDYEELGNKEIVFESAIALKNLSFSYGPKAQVLEHVNLVLKKGLRVGFVGESGAGKSTIADIIMGLFVPQKGGVYVDDVRLTQENLKCWRRKIGYIPQDVYLFHGTVAENVVCGRAFDETMIIDALKKARMYDFLMSKDGIYTRLGEGGINVSGGQKQRIAIARALYANPEVLVLDEATSSLDNETEEHIMDEIYQVDRNKTLIIIAHRLSTIERCDVVYKVDGGCVMQVRGQIITGDQIPSPVVSA